MLLCNGVLILSSIIFAFSFSESVHSSIYQTNSHQRSTEGRVKQWEEITTLTRKYPFFGIGSKNYALLENQTRQLNFENSFAGRLNNTYIQSVVEKGWTGLLLWLCVIGILFFRLFRQIKKEENPQDKAMCCIFFSAVLAVLFREIFFSTLLYNSGVLLLFFILLTFHDNNSKSINLTKPVVLVSYTIFVFGTFYFYFKKPENALQYATRGLEYERSAGIQVPYDKMDCYSKTDIQTGNDAIISAIQQYKEACRVSPYDAVFQHNLGWLYWMNHRQDLAIIYLSQSVKTDPNNAICHISKGLISESQELELAFENYKQAILLSPDIIDSPFFSDLKERHPEKAKQILQDAYKELLQAQSVRYSSIIEAKTGKILLDIGNLDAAFKTLSYVTQIHPNLNRPWFYLGYMEQLKGNETAMQEYYKKSLFLSSFDHLPLYAFAAYYIEIGDNLKMESYYKSAERAWKNRRSAHSLHCKWMYYEDTEKDDIIPQGLLDYVSPAFHLIK